MCRDWHEWHCLSNNDITVISITASHLRIYRLQQEIFKYAVRHHYAILSSKSQIILRLYYIYLIFLITTFVLIHEKIIVIGSICNPNFVSCTGKDVWNKQLALLQSIYVANPPTSEHTVTYQQTWHAASSSQLLINCVLKLRYMMCNWQWHNRQIFSS